MPVHLEIFLRAVTSVALIVLLTRLNGLRSFSKMSGFDFAITVATGSVLASTILSPSRDYLVGVVGILSLFIVQGVLAGIRRRSGLIEGLLDNSPLLVMRDGAIIDDNLRAANMTRSDLYAKLREANAYDLSTVRAVVMESTGDVSVLHGDAPIDDRVMEGVRDTV